MQPLEDKNIEREIASEMELRGDFGVWNLRGECRQTVKLDRRAKILDSEYDINE